MAPGVVVGSVFLARDHHVRLEQGFVGAGANFIWKTRFNRVKPVTSTFLFSRVELRKETIVTTAEKME